METSTFFVNREREVVELALYNALCIHRFIMRYKEPRCFYFVFAAQMYGAGKTRMGEEFVSQIRFHLNENRDVFTKYCPLVCTTLLPDLIKIVEHFPDAKYVHITLGNGIETYQGFLEFIQYESLTQFVADMCDIVGKPVFIHFDEVGGFKVEELRKLRDNCYRSWQYCIDSKSTDFNVPLFFFSGRGAAYNELGSLTSSICSHWLVLEPLLTQHVRGLIMNSTLYRSKFEFHKSLSKQQIDVLCDHLISWTGGAPRPLLYIINMLELLHKCHGDLYKTRAGLNDIFNAFATFIESDNDMLKELGPVSPWGKKLTRDELSAYQYFCFYSLLEMEINVDHKIFKSKHIASIYLRSFNIFASLGKNRNIRLIAPQFVQRIVLAKKCAAKRLQRFSKKKIQSRSREIEACVASLVCLWHSLTRHNANIGLLPHIIPADVCMPSVVFDYDFHAWNTRGPVIQKDGLLQHHEIDTIVKNRGIGNNTKQLKWGNLEYFCKKLPIGDVVVTGPKSAASDIIIKIGERDLIELQCKSGKQVLSLENVEKEVKKSVSRHSSIFRSTFVLIIPCGTSYCHTKESVKVGNVDVYIPSESELQLFFGYNLQYF